MKIVDYCIRQPITVAVGVGLSLLAGVMALTSVPVQMKPDVDSVVISISTFWESASAEEIESDIVEEQEKVLSDVGGLVSLTSNSKAGQGVVRLEFETGTDLEVAKADVVFARDGLQRCAHISRPHRHIGGHVCSRCTPQIAHQCSSSCCCYNHNRHANMQGE